MYKHVKVHIWPVNIMPITKAKPRILLLCSVNLNKSLLFYRILTIYSYITTSSVIFLVRNFGRMFSQDPLLGHPKLRSKINVGITGNIFLFCAFVISSFLGAHHTSEGWGDLIHSPVVIYSLTHSRKGGRITGSFC